MPTRAMITLLTRCRVKAYRLNNDVTSINSECNNNLTVVGINNNDLFYNNKSLLRGQSNLAKAASNAPQTVHVLDSIAISVLKMCRGSQKFLVT